jgi:hypothetical protein
MCQTTVTASVRWLACGGRLRDGGGVSAGLVMGAMALADRAREFLGVSLVMMGLFLLVPPLSTTLLLVWGRDSRRLRAFHIMAYRLESAAGRVQIGMRSGRWCRSECCSD